MTMPMLTVLTRGAGPLRAGALLLVGVALSTTVPWSLAYADHTISERRSATPEGVVDLVDLAGSVEVLAWDREEVEVTGTLEETSDRIEVTGSGNRISISGVSHAASRHAGVEAKLIVHVPVRSTVTATLVTGDLDVEGVQGDVRLHTVSGDIKGNVKGDVRVSTVSGSVHMTALAARTLEAKTISGDIELTGGNGDVEVGTVSGTAKVSLGTVTRARFKSISGDLSAKLTLSPDARIEGESISGEVDLEFASVPDTQFDVQSFSGEINNCFGPKPTKSDYGTGSRLAFGSGESHGRVRIVTQSGSIKLCTKNLHASQASPFLTPVARVAARSTNIFYVL
jgi:DUF4097 and DUF4098 domain-containing protein YvlB